MSPVARSRVGLAFGLTPFVCALFGFLLFPLLLRTHPGQANEMFESAVGFGVLVGLIGALITGGLAHPLFERLSKRGPLTAAQTILSGALLGNIPAAVAIIGTVLVRRDASALTGAMGGSWRAIVFGTAIGALSSSVFWLIAAPQIAPAATDSD